METWECTSGLCPDCGCLGALEWYGSTVNCFGRDEVIVHPEIFICPHRCRIEQTRLQQLFPARTVH